MNKKITQKRNKLIKITKIGKYKLQSVQAKPMTMRDDCLTNKRHKVGKFAMPFIGHMVFMKIGHMVTILLFAFKLFVD